VFFLHVIGLFVFHTIALTEKTSDRFFCAENLF